MFHYTSNINSRNHCSADVSNPQLLLLSVEHCRGTTMGYTDSPTYRVLLLLLCCTLQAQYNEWGFDQAGFDKDGFDKYGYHRCGGP